jgi:hypothetical protein
MRVRLMTPNTQPLVKKKTLDPAQDFYRLRREGVGSIVKTGSANWTDYNVHDPGVTILEALCYAITDIGRRVDWDIADILSPQPPPTDSMQPYPNQAFFTARDILTVNPTTSDDFRRLLIDSPGVHDAWLLCKTCACEASYFAWCDDQGQLALSYSKPANVTPEPKEVWSRGLYEALLELEDDPELGDLNDRLIVSSSVLHDSDGAHPATMELRFPDVSLLERDQWQAFLSRDADVSDPNGFQLHVTRLGATKTFDVFTEFASDADRDAYIRSNWPNIFYFSFQIDLPSLGSPIVIENAALRVFGDTAVRNATTAADWRSLFEDKTASGAIFRYREKAKAALAAVTAARTALQSHRNLDEDYCIISSIGVEEVAVCADVELEPDADIENVQAQIWFTIEQYFSPPIRFRTLQELRDAGEAVEDIFNGPALNNGFIEADDLTAAAFKTVLRVSDIINALMKIDGVIAINQLRLTKFDSEGNPVSGAADPTWGLDGQPVFDPAKNSAAWLLFISGRHQPRLYMNQSRFLFYKSGLPFLPRMDEATDTLNQLRGDAQRLKNPDAVKDLRIPRGEFREPAPDEYSAVQDSLPLAYGVGPAGLPSHASPARRGQAKDLKAYLMVFEQLLGNALTQIAHTADLFSLDPGMDRTYFVKALDASVIAGFGDIVKKPDDYTDDMAGLIETLPEFYERRNRFLDHMLARFGEDFGEYALLLTDATGNTVVPPRLIENKIAFLKRYPTISYERARAFDYTTTPSSPDNHPGLKKRINLLLGYPDLTFVWRLGPPSAGNYPVSFNLVDGNGRSWLVGDLTVAAANEASAKEAAYRILIVQMILPDAYDIAAAAGQFTLKLRDASATEIGGFPQPFALKSDAEAMRGQLAAWSANERLIIVEHLLLRPKFNGDALYPACCDSACGTCGNEDPYSFRLTFVMPGWTEQYTDNLTLRRFAERTIRQETPAHLMGKICWVGNDGYAEDPCDLVVGQLADLLVSEGLTTGGVPPSDDDACACAQAIYHAFSTVFVAWYAEKKFTFIHADALDTTIAGQFQTEPKATDISCTTVLTTALWKTVQEMMTAHFVEIALYGWQFERFEWTWRQWLDANAAIDWASERLMERVEAVLASNLKRATPQSELCDHTRTVLTDYGTRFYKWMESNIVAGAAFGALSAFTPPAIVLPADEFKPEAAVAIAALLKERYGAYAEPSYWLWALVTVLSNLRSTYPGATLHDCDDGSDQNPVRLDNTALGNYPHRTKLS